MYLVAIPLLFLVVFLHEYGHLRVMHKYGIKVKKLSIGIDIPYLTIRIHHPQFCFGVPVSISPLLVMGMVKTGNGKKISDLSLPQQLEIYGAGIIMNLAFGFFLLMTSTHSTQQFVTYFIIGTVILLFGNKISTFLFPLFSLATFYFVPRLLVEVFRSIPDAGRSTSAILLNFRLPSFSAIFMAVGLLSIFAGLLNLIPMQPLDGGKIISACGKRWLPSKVMIVYDRLTLIIMLGVILVSMYDLLLASIRLFLKVVV